MRVVEFSSSRLVIEETGTGFGVVCIIVGHAIALMPLAVPTWNWWTGALEVAIGVAVAAYGAVALTRTRTQFDRVNGVVSYARRNFFRARFLDASLNEVEDVLLERGAREPVPFAQEATFEEHYPYRVALRVRGRVWPLGRTYRDYKQAQHVASLIRGVLDEWAGKSLRLL